MNVHFFLEEERLRLRKTQEEMAELGGVKLRTYANYASGERKPDAAFLSAIAASGADVQYILTGVRSTPAMTAQQERAGYIVEVLSPAEAQAIHALRTSGALASHQSATVHQTGAGNVFQQSAGAKKNEIKPRTRGKK